MVEERKETSVMKTEEIDGVKVAGLTGQRSRREEESGPKLRADERTSGHAADAAGAAVECG